ncbi:MAG: radical SAM protein [Anaerovoracaceae bacterium]
MTSKITRDEIIDLLTIENGSKDYFDLLARAYRMSREKFGQRGYVFAQIGLNAEPCTANCKFCTFGENHFSAEQRYKKSKAEILEEVQSYVEEGIDALFLMTTADYPIEAFLSIAEEVKKKLNPETELIANIGDFDEVVAGKLIEKGFTGVYHICRLGEGTDTEVEPERRVATIEALKGVGLALYYCIEPIGPEHTPEQIADEIQRAIRYEVDVMAVMRRVPAKGTPMAEKGTIDLLEFTKIAAVTRIAVDPKKSMNAHETNQMTLLAGINQLYAESGSNPRDNRAETQGNRGLSVRDCKAILRDARYEV